MSLNLKDLKYLETLCNTRKEYLRTLELDMNTEWNMYKVVIIERAKIDSALKGIQEILKL